MEVRDKIIGVLKDILLAKSMESEASGEDLEILPRHELTNDLGLKSLDLAELVATLELETGIDPFARDNAVTDVRTVEDLLQVYQSDSSTESPSDGPGDQVSRRAALRRSAMAAASKHRSADEQDS